MSLASKPAEDTALFEVAPYFVCLRPFRTRPDESVKDPVHVEVSALISPEQAREVGILPFQKVGTRIYVAVLAPMSEWTRELVNQLPGPVVMCRVDPEDLMWAQDRAYGLPRDLPDKTLGGILLSQDRVKAIDLVSALEAQPDNGARIGAMLTSANAVTHWDVADAVARQRGMPLIDLLNDGQPSPLLLDPSAKPVWDVMGEEFWSRHLTVPLAMTPRTVSAAMVDPDDQEAIGELGRRLSRQVTVFVTGYRDVAAALNVRYGSRHEEASRESLLRETPENSAFKQLSLGQKVVGIISLLILGLGFALNAGLTGTMISAFLELFYGGYSLFRLWMMYRTAKSSAEVIVTMVDLEEVPLTSLPAYTVLVPLYREAAVLPTLTRALMALQYPKDRLDVKLLLEEDDEETIIAAKAANLPSYVELVVVPASEPRTKPKACNYGLQKARGEYLVIYDAEDIPEPDQLLKAVAVFRRSNDDVACVQAKLSYFNHAQNVLTRWFTAEYANWFDLLLPSLFSLNLPIPLGGSSNHFRTKVLNEAGAWDPFNVTEDADLGIRLHKKGYRTAIMNSTTYEEANADFVNWVRQRSRWVKGYIQTWLVHMRHPVRLFKEVGPKSFFGFQFIVGGTPLMFLVSPLLWALTISWFVFGPNFARAIFPGWILYLALLNLVLGNFAFAYTNIVGLARREHWVLVKYAVFSPIYWIFMSIGAWKGLYQLFTRPSYWEKTIHGLARGSHGMDAQPSIKLPL